MFPFQRCGYRIGGAGCVSGRPGGARLTGAPLPRPLGVHAAAEGAFGETLGANQLAVDNLGAARQRVAGDRGDLGELAAGLGEARHGGVA